MVLKTILTAFGLIFLAELGDKTQLTTMLLAAQTRAPVAVFIGAGLALLLTTLLGVLIGDMVTRVVSPRMIRVIAGAAFIIIGGLLVTGKV